MVMVLVAYKCRIPYNRTKQILFTCHAEPFVKTTETKHLYYDKRDPSGVALLRHFLRVT